MTAFDITRLPQDYQAPEVEDRYLVAAFTCGHCKSQWRAALEYRGELDLSEAGWRWVATPDADGEVNEGDFCCDLCPDCADAFVGDSRWRIKDYPGSGKWLKRLPKPVSRGSWLQVVESGRRDQERAK